MESNIKLAGLLCKNCGWELLVLEEKVFCQNPKCKNYDNTYLQIRPKGV